MHTILNCTSRFTSAASMSYIITVLRIFVVALLLLWTFPAFSQESDVAELLKTIESLQKLNAEVAPLVVAAEEGDSATTKSLISKGVDLEQRDAFGYTALMKASHSGHAMIVDMLLAAGANVNTPGEFGATALYGSISGKHPKIAMRLLGQGANVNARTRSGGSPLITAVYFGQTDIVRELLRRNANPNARENSGRTALSLARSRSTQRTDLVEMLIAAGASE